MKREVQARGANAEERRGQEKERRWSYLWLWYLLDLSAIKRYFKGGMSFLQCHDSFFFRPAKEDSRRMDMDGHRAEVAENDDEGIKLGHITFTIVWAMYKLKMSIA